MAERLERWIFNSEAASSSPTLTASRIRSRSFRVQILGHVCVKNILLICLLLIGVLNHVMFTTIVPGKPNGTLKRCSRANFYLFYKNDSRAVFTWKRF